MDNHITSRKVIRTHLINIADIAIEYAYKFLDAKEGMCITLLAEKCIIFLAQAIGMQYGCVPTGPSATATLSAEGYEKTRQKSLSLYVIKNINQTILFCFNKKSISYAKTNAINNIYTNYLSSNNDKKNNTIEKVPVTVKDIGHSMRVFTLAINIVLEHR